MIRETQGAGVRYDGRKTHRSKEFAVILKFLMIYFSNDYLYKMSSNVNYHGLLL
jgi:hypothetical protein